MLMSVLKLKIVIHFPFKRFGNSLVTYLSSKIKCNIALFIPFEVSIFSILLRSPVDFCLLMVRMLIINLWQGSDIITLELTSAIPWSRQI